MNYLIIILSLLLIIAMNAYIIYLINDFEHFIDFASVNFLLPVVAGFVLIIGTIFIYNFNKDEYGNHNVESMDGGIESAIKKQNYNI